MIDPDSICMRCMSELPSPKCVCPHCGFDNASAHNEAHQLECGSILAGTYLIGRVLGQGGFGITYIGWDLNLDIKVAIKEYYPEGCVTRDTHTHVSVLTYAGEKETYFQKGKERFVNEAKTLAKFSGDGCVVGVRAFFYENGTAYIVMDFVEGETLKSYVARRGGKLPSAEVLELFKPLFRSLARVHEMGLLHRDISPDNIMLRPDGTLALLDFGAARQMSVAGEHSNTINVKHGFAPEEQYRTRGEQGPWTDVYALCATIYRLTTGVTPPQALDRMANAAVLTPPNQLGADFTPAQEQAVVHGLAVFAPDRTQDIRQLTQELSGGAPDVSEDAKVELHAAESSESGCRIRTAPNGITAGIDGEPPESQHSISSASEQGASSPQLKRGEAGPKKIKLPRKQKGSVWTAALCGISIIIICCLIVPSVTRSRKRQQIQTCIEQRDYDAALVLIQEIGDDTTILDDAIYEYTQQLLDEGEYELAESTIEKINHPENYDMTSVQNRIAYQSTEALFVQGSIASAMDSLIDLQEKGSSYAIVLLSKYSSKIYNYGVKEYRSDEIAAADTAFSLVSPYARSGDYLMLIEIRQAADSGTLHWNNNAGVSDLKARVEQLAKMVQFEDAGALLMSTTDSALVFLLGNWEYGAARIEFSLNEGSDYAYQASWAITGIPSGTWRFANGDFYLTDSSGVETKVAKFTIVDAVTIEILVYKTEKVYTLNRKA